jgi:hypothetical protein
LQQNHLKKREERKEKVIFNKGDKLNGSGSTFEKHQNTGSSLMEEERNLAQNEFRKILCSSQVMFPVPP